jgi:hypothetical protein
LAPALEGELGEGAPEIVGRDRIGIASDRAQNALRESNTVSTLYLQSMTARLAGDLETGYLENGQTKAM